MEILQYYARSDDYCSACLNSSSEAPLLPNNANEFFSSIVVNVLTQWLCNRCSGTLQAYNELRTRAERAQNLLSDILINTEMVQAKSEYYITELNQIKSIPNHILVTVTPQPNIIYVSESQNSKVEKHQSRADVKTECLDPTVVIKDETYAANVSDFKLENDNHPAAYRCSSSLSHEPDGPDEDHIGVGFVTTVGDCETKAKGASSNATRYDGEPFNILGTETSVVIGERDDVLSSDIVNSNVKQIKITEQQYRKWFDERLQSEEYINSKYKCDNCAIVFEHGQPLSRHMNRHSKNVGPHRCHLCTRYFDSGPKLGAHMKGHRYHYVCVKCGVHTNSQRDTADHYFSAHTRVEFHCKYCDFVSRRLSFVGQHIYTGHIKPRVQVECKVCKRVVRKIYLDKHMRTHANNLAVEVYCSLCAKKFKNQNTLMQHMKLFHLGLSGEECSICHKWIMHGSKKGHERTHTRENVTCTLCNQEFANVLSLNAHMKRKHSDGAGRKFECHDCGKGFYTKSEISSHAARVHLKICSFQCTMCEEKFVVKRQLKAHVQRIHENIQAPKDKMCDVCGKGFSTSALLNNHRLIHTGERPHACAQCGRAFRQRAAMRTHVQLVHMGIKYKDLLANRKKQKKVMSKNQF